MDIFNCHLPKQFAFPAILSKMRVYDCYKSGIMIYNVMPAFWSWHEMDNQKLSDQVTSSTCTSLQDMAVKCLLKIIDLHDPSTGGPQELFLFIIFSDFLFFILYFHEFLFFILYFRGILYSVFLTIFIDYSVFWSFSHSLFSISILYQFSIFMWKIFI